MAVAAIKDYAFEPRDRVENFHGAQLVFIGWEDHLMFAAPHAFPFPPTMPLRAVVEQVLPGVYGYHPDFEKIDWSRVEWLKSSEPFVPDLDKSLADNGIGHKALIRFRTPGLTGIGGSCS